MSLCEETQPTFRNMSRIFYLSPSARPLPVLKPAPKGRPTKAQAIGLGPTVRLAFGRKPCKGENAWRDTG